MTLINTAKDERTEVFSGEEDAMRILLQAMANVKKEAVVCSDAKSPAFSMGIDSVKKGYIDFKKRGVRIRQIVEITRDNLEYCKEFMNYVELRHMDGIKGNMAVSETEYVATAILEGAEPLTQTIYSNVKAFLEQQRYFFETLWNKAIPASRRIVELEQGLEPEFVEVISDTSKARHLLVNIVESAREYVRVLLPNSEAIVRTEKMGLWAALIQVSKRGIKVRVICPISDVHSPLVKKLHDEFGIEFIRGNEVQSGIVIVDQFRFVSAELINSFAETFEKAIGIALYSNSRRTISMLVSFFDSLWNRVELYEQLRLANEKLELHDTRQREFINIAAHELRTPIQPILGVIELLDSQFSKEDGAKETGEITKEELAILIRNAKRLERLTSNILDIPRIESGTLHLNVQEFDLNNVISSTVEDARNEVNTNRRNKKHLVKLHYSSPVENNSAVIKGDKDRISQVVWNLLNNAIKFTEDGDILISTKKENNNQVTVTVKDSGSGIDPEILPRLFTKFVTKSEKGTGLGLYISKSIVEAHGGKIWAENNTDGKGATFTFTVPLN